MVQWINLNRNNRSVLACQYVLYIVYEKTGHILLPLVGVTKAGREADDIRVGLKNFKILYRLDYSDFKFA